MHSAHHQQPGASKKPQSQSSLCNEAFRVSSYPTALPCFMNHWTSLNTKVETASDTQSQDSSATTAFEFREYRIGATLAVFTALFSQKGSDTRSPCLITQLLKVPQQWPLVGPLSNG